MPSKESFTSATLKVTQGTVETNSARQLRTSLSTVSPRISGGWTVFPNGSKFRKPTAYFNKTCSITQGSPQETTGRQNDGRVDTIKSSPGGYASDILLTSNCPPFKSGIGSMSKLYDTPTIPLGMGNEAVTKALLNIADQKAGIAEDLATFRQTLNLIRNPATTLADSLKKAYADKSVRPFINRSLRSIRNEGPLNVGAQKYLEYVYGWKPLVGDIYGVMELLKEGGAKNSLLLSGTGHARQSSQAESVQKTDLSAGALTILGPLNERAHVSCKIWGRIDPSTAGLRSLNQLGLLNPLSLSWELVPYSFVLDWFVPIGSVLQALTAPVGLTFVSGTKSIRTSLSGPYTHRKTSLDAIATSNNYAGGNATAETYKREVLSSWPLPGAWINPTPFSGDRWLKALALTILGLRNNR